MANDIRALGNIFNVVEFDGTEVQWLSMKKDLNNILLANGIEKLRKVPV